MKRKETCHENRGPKGGIQRVEPIKNVEDIKKIKRLLKDQPRNLLLFVLGINTNLRSCDLVQLTVGDVKYVDVNGEFTVREKKTGKLRSIIMNQAVHKAVHDWLDTQDLGDNAPLFMGLRGNITAGTVRKLVKGWCKEIGLRGRFGAHTLRKTWGFHQRVRFKTPLPILMVMFNHSNQKQTLDYLCIQEDEVHDAYRRVI